MRACSEPHRSVFATAALLCLAAASRPAAAVESAQPGFPLRAKVAIEAPLPAQRVLLQSAGLDLAAVDRLGRVEALLDPEEIAWVEGQGMAVETLVADIYADFYQRHGTVLGNNLADYSDYQQNVDELLAMEAAYPQLARTEVIGSSIEGRAIYALKISDRVDTDEPEPEVLLMAIHHAREPVSNETVLELSRRLLGGYGSDPQMTFLVDHREIWVVPIVNPDGYAYVDDVDPYWRKNRRGGYGVDINRNYSYKWGYDNWGSSGYKWDETYRGTAPWSEPETAAIRDLVEGHLFTYALTFHTYGDYYLYPWGYKWGSTPDDSHFRSIAQEMSRDNHYTYGTTAATLYPVNGECADWLYGEQSTKGKIFGFTVEIGYDFWPNRNDIPALVEENMEPTFYFLEQAGGLHDGDLPLTLSNTPSSIQPGQSVSWDAHATNIGGEHLTVDSWVVATAAVLPPQGATAMLVQNMSVSASYDQTVTVNAVMPANAPAGNYTFTQRVGDFATGEIYGEDSFQATVN
jgi:murein tripeptide amidase MpaA